MDNSERLKFREKVSYGFGDLASSMSQEIGWTIGGAISGWILAVFGFEANAVQTVTSLLGIRLMINIFAATGALLSVGILYFYPLSEKFMIKIKDIICNILNCSNEY